METSYIKTKDSFKLIGKKKVNYADVILLKADINYTEIFLKNGEVHLVAKSLKTFEEQFSKTSFFRVHKSYLINLNYVRKPRKELKDTLKMRNNLVVLVSRRRKDEFVKAVGWN